MRRAAAGLLLIGLAAPALGADFFLYLRCAGQVSAGGKSMPSTVDLALRDNNNTALIQQSNTLPVGERLKYVASPMAFTMSYQVPGARTTLIHDWWNGQIFVWQPSLKQVTTVRLSIDRQSGKLAGEMLNVEAQPLAKLALDCNAVSEDELAKRKF